MQDACNVPCYQVDLVERVQQTIPPPEALQELAQLFGLLADPTRLRIVAALASGEELCVCDVANVLRLSLSATSHQLRKLRDAGVVSFRNDGRMAYYRMRDPFLGQLMQQARTQLERV